VARAQCPLMLIRREIPGDAAAIHTVTSAAFARADQP
jgi:hypothetical protein